MTLSETLEQYRQRITNAAVSPFDHAEFPLANTLSYQGDPGLFGPDSITWRVVGDAAAFVGGIRALLIQAAHPEVAAGVSDHSNYREDPLGRLSRTSSYVTATSYGAMPEVEAAINAVRQAHRPVRGVSHRGQAYSAGHPEMAAWVHNALVESFLMAYQFYGPRPLTSDEANQFVSEQTKLGAQLGARPLPDTADDLHVWVTNHPDLTPSPAMKETVQFLRNPRQLDLPTRAGYWALLDAAVATVPANLRDLLGVYSVPGNEFRGRQAVRLLRWALGASPSWNLALLRTDQPIPDGVFHDRLTPDRLNPV